MTCPVCNGTGKETIAVDAEEIEGMVAVCIFTMFLQVNCHRCKGTGKIKKEGEKNGL